MRYEVYFRPAAERDLRRLPPNVQRRIIQQITALSKNPRPPNSQELHGPLRGIRRLRIGNYRASYLIDDKARVVRIGRIGHRSTFYRKLKRRP